MSESKGERLRALFMRPETVLMPFGILPIHARMAQLAGFEAFEVSGGLSSWWNLGMADVGYATQTEVVQQAAAVAAAVDIPVFCDADTGYGGAVSVQRTVRAFLSAGVAGIHLEDQADPKKAGGRAGIRLVPDTAAIGRLNAAVDTRDREDPDFVIVARTDGYAVGGLDEAIRRGLLYRSETGADVVFYEGLTSWDEARIALAETPGPAYVILTRAVRRTPSRAELTAMGQSIQIVNFTLPGIHEVWDLLLRVRDADDLAPIDDYRERIESTAGTERYVSWGERLLRLGYEEAAELDRRYPISHTSDAP